MSLNFSENFKQLRKEKGDTQEKIAEVLGVTGQTVSRWELSICYPDLELLPSIANYFGVTVDTLLSNDNNSKEKDREIFYEKIYSFDFKNSTESIDFARGYCRKYPDDDQYAYELVCCINLYAAGNEERTARYMPILLKTAEKLLETRYRSGVIQMMTALCSGEELNKWLDMAPYAGFSRRYCLINRASVQNEDQDWYIQQGLENLETMADQLDRRCPDSFGAVKKAEYQREVLRVIESFGTNGEIPDGWKMFYAYKQLVLAACLFGQEKLNEGWREFDSAIEKCKYIYALDEDLLSIGDRLFSNLKVSKDWRYAVDEQGNKHALFAVVRLSFYYMDIIYDLLTSQKWAWFNSVRNTEKYREVVAWAKSIKQAQEK